MTDNNTNNTVSIITPVYNGEKYIAQTIESVLAQTYPDWEMLIIDDGSRDNSAAIARDYCARDSRISLYSQTNAGSAAARNNGIRRARGRYIALLDADDLWDSTFLASQLNFMKEKGALLVCSAHRRIDEYGRECLKPFFPPGKATYTDLLRTCSILCLTGLYDTSAYGKVFLNEKFKSLRDDLVYWLEIVKKTGAVYGNQEIIASFRISGTSVTHNKKKVIVPQYKVYRESEGLSRIKSLYYLLCWAWNGFIKYRR